MMTELNPLTIGGAVAIALGLVETVKVALIKLIDGNSSQSTNYTLGKVEWRTRMESLVQSQHEMQKEILALQRVTVECLRRLTDNNNIGRGT